PDRLTPIDWYVDQVNAVRQRLPGKRIVVFCDEAPQAVSSLLALPGVEFSKTSSHPLLDMAHLAGMVALIFSGNLNLALWVNYFGEMPMLVDVPTGWELDLWAPFSRLTLGLRGSDGVSDADYDRFAEAVVDRRVDVRRTAKHALRFRNDVFNCECEAGFGR